jgi:hypothetical protein
VAHQASSSTEVSPFDGGTQCNGDHCFLRGRIDPGGHRWPPTYSTGSTYSFHFGFFYSFLGPKLLGHFEALNRRFFDMEAPNKCLLACIGLFRMCTPWLDLSNLVSSAPNKDRMQKLCPREVDISTTPIGAHKPFGISSSGLGFWMFRVFSFMLYVKKAFGASL